MKRARPSRKLRPRTARAGKHRASAAIVIPAETMATLIDPYRTAWLLLTPGERLMRSWKLRERIVDPQAVHDAKTLPEL